MRFIRRIRHAADLHQDDLAEQAGVDRSYVAKIENGRSSRLLDLVFDLLRSLDAEITITSRGHRRG